MPLLWRMRFYCSAQMHSFGQAYIPPSCVLSQCSTPAYGYIVSFRHSDVAWAPSLGLPSSAIASCSQDGLVVIWSQEDHSAGEWSRKPMHKFADVVWRLSWSVTGKLCEHMNTHARTRTTAKCFLHHTRSLTHSLIHSLTTSLTDS